MESFVREKGLKQKVLLQGKKVAREMYLVNGPSPPGSSSFFIDRSGTVVERVVGFGPEKAEAFKSKIRQLLAQGE